MDADAQNRAAKARREPDDLMEPQTRQLLSEIERMLANNTAERLEEKIATRMEMHWASFVRLMGHLTPQERRTLLYVLINKLDRFLIRFEVIAEFLCPDARRPEAEEDKEEEP